MWLFSSPPFQIQFWKVFLTLSQCNAIWRGEQIDNSEQICSSYFTNFWTIFDNNFYVQNAVWTIFEQPNFVILPGGGKLEKSFFFNPGGYDKPIWSSHLFLLNPLLRQKMDDYVRWGEGGKEPSICQTDYFGSFLISPFQNTEFYVCFTCYYG